MKVGILGGTFDPPHVGHLLAASDACDTLGLERLTFVPNSRQPLKDDGAQSSPADRLAMVHLAVDDDARFTVDALEVERGGVSYSVDTLETMTQRAPDDELYFLVGADSVRTFAQWRAPQRIARLARLAVLTRADRDATPLVEAEVRDQLAAATGAGSEPPILLPSRRIDVSSTEIRERVRTGRSIHGFVPVAVARFIHERGLYR